MSAKTCQLCGKPLGRIRVGSDGDFCCREHRNQSRLRRGMDRLEEANKVANLMRRRESPRHIPMAQLVATSSQEPRAVLDAAAFPSRPLEARTASFMPALFHVRAMDGGSRFTDPMADLSHRSAAAHRIVAPASLPFVAKASSAPVLGLPRVLRPSAGIAPAKLASIGRGVPAAKETWRECGALLRVSRPAVCPPTRLKLEAPGTARLDQARKVRPLEPAPAAAGEALTPRGSTVLSFEKRAPSLHPRQAQVNSPGEVTHSRLQARTLPEALDVSTVKRSCAVSRTEPRLRVPRVHAPQSATGTHQRDALQVQPAAYDSAAPVTPRTCTVSRETEALVNFRALRSAGIPGRALQGRNPLPLNAARDAAREHRPAEVAFAPADSGFDHGPMALLGSLGPAGEAASAPEPIEEHFNAGLEQWMGDTTGWRLDVAGARPAGLALLRATVGMSDYEFEFFTRVESRAVTFVFRASNLSNYLKVTLALVESGRYELRRCAVIGGIEETAAVAPLPGVIRPGAAFTVKTRASQNDFTIWLDGEVAARWTDGRLPIGGIGFVAQREDRARVYWVRLSQPGGPNSHAAPHRTPRSIQ